MNKTFIQISLLVALSSAGVAGAAGSTPLSRYLPAGALGVLEAQNLRDAADHAGALRVAGRTAATAGSQQRGSQETKDRHAARTR